MQEGIFDFFEKILGVWLPMIYYTCKKINI